LIVRSDEAILTQLANP